MSEALPAPHLREGTEPPTGLARLLAHRQRAAELAWVIAGKLAMMGANAALMLLLAERLELNLYGLFMTSIGGQLLLSRVLMLGVDRGVIRLHTLPDLRQRSRDLYSAGLAVIRRMSALALLTAIAVVWALSSSASPLGSSWPGWMVASMVAGAIGAALVDYGYSVYLSQLRYRAAALSQGVTSLGKLAVTVLAILLWPDRPLAVFLAYFSASLVSGLWLTARRELMPRGGDTRHDRGLVSRLLRYSLWQGGTNFIALLYLYQGTFLLTWLGNEAAAGVFGLGVMLSAGVHAVCIAYSEYLLPRAARVESLNALLSFLSRATGGALALALGGIPVTAAVGTVVAGIVNPELQDIAPVFYCLSASMLLLVCTAPLEAVCNYLLQPQLVTLGWALRAVCVGGFALALAPSGGAWGVAVAQLGGTAVGVMAFAVCVVAALRAARKSEK